MIRAETPKQYCYTGRLAHIITSYVNEKRGMGLKFETDAKKLHNFDKFTHDFVFEKDSLPKELALAYTEKLPGENESNRNLRIGILRRFAEYMCRCGYDAYILPQSKRCGQGTSFTPYIFSEDEVKRIFNAADSIEENSYNRHICLAAPLLFRMFYSCGMRESEVVYLTVADVDLENGIIRIGETKFNKSRYVPMSESLWKMCVSFAEAVHQSDCLESPFFPNKRNEFFSPGAIYDLFRKVLWSANISHGGKGKGPRLHDFRHTFAVHCLKKWSLNDVDLMVSLPYLSAYLGHVGLLATQNYLRLTADVFPYITEALDAKFSNIIPEMGGEFDGD